MPYQPYIEEPGLLTAFAGQRFVVLRASAEIAARHRELQNELRRQFSDLPISYPAFAHVTLAGFSETPLAAVQDLVERWVRGVEPLTIASGRLAVFPAPSQLVFVEVDRTPELVAALTTVREQAVARNLGIVTAIAVRDWTFHMSLAYGEALPPDAWVDVARAASAMAWPRASYTAEAAEVVAFDDGREYSGGTYPLRRTMKV